MDIIEFALLGLGVIFIIVKLWNHPAVLNNNPEDFTWGSDSALSSDFGSDDGKCDSDGGCDGGDGGD